MRNLFLIGMMGSWKSTVGRKLADVMKMEFIDTDDAIEEITEMRISDIFHEFGEEKFREMETAFFKEKSKQPGQVFSTGGGIVLDVINREILKNESGPPPPVNLSVEKKNGLTLLKLIEKNLILSAHDVSLGGIIVTIAEMCIDGKIGAKIEKKNMKNNKSLNSYLFGEDQGRYIIEIENKNLKLVNYILKNNKVYSEIIGKTQKKSLELQDTFDISVSDLLKINSKWIDEYIK